MEQVSLDQLEKAAGIASTLLGAAKTFGSAVKSDFAELPRQIGAITQGGANRQFLRTSPVALARTPGTGMMLNQPKTQIKDLVKNKALLTGAAGVAGASALMTPRNPQSDNNIQKYACENKYLEKIAELFSDENKQVGKTFATQTVASVPAHIIGAAVGGALGAKHLEGAADSISRVTNKATVGARRGLRSNFGEVGKTLSKGLKLGKGSGAALGVGLGMAAAGGAADLLSLKHSLHGKVKENE